MEVRHPARRPKDLNGWLFDGAIAFALVALNLSLLLSLVGRRSVDNVALAAALLVVHGGCVLWRRSAPATVLAVNVGTAVAFAFLGFPVVALGVAILIAGYTAASELDRRSSLIALMLTIGAMVVVLGFGPIRTDVSTVVSNVVALAVIWFLGDAQRTRRAYVLELENRTAELERARGDLARSAVAEERVRIARELHDVVAHSMGLIAVQAGVGAHVIDSRPDEAKRSLQAIEQASKSALGEIRRMLGLLRSSDEDPETHPSPGLEDLRRLVGEISRTGPLQVDLQLDAPPDDVSSGVELTIYRIVQEAITNVIKHAAASRARVAVRFSHDVATIEVVDDGTGAPPHPSVGHGILGMRERATMHGGALETSSLREGGFRVAASIPLRGRQA